MDITKWSTLKSDWLYSLQPNMEKLYTVSKNKTGCWLWFRSPLRQPFIWSHLGSLEFSFLMAFLKVYSLRAPFPFHFLPSVCLQCSVSFPYLLSSLEVLPNVRLKCLYIGLIPIFPSTSFLQGSHWIKTVSSSEILNPANGIVIFLVTRTPSLNHPGFLPDQGWWNRGP